VRLYFDTAYIAKCYLNEPEGLAVRRLARRASGLYSSMLAIAELSCVFHRQVREGRLDKDQAGEWRAHFLEDLNNGVWVLLPVTERILFRVDALVSAVPTGVFLRSGDAIHLVTALEASFPEIWSNDRDLLGAAGQFGLRGRSV